MNPNLPNGHNRFLPGGAMDLSHIPQRKVWTCEAGHEFDSVDGFYISVMKMAGNQTLRAGPICPICYGQFLGTTFQSWPKGEERPELIAEDRDDSPETAAVLEAERQVKEEGQP